MYEAFYGFKEKPFSMLPDPGFLFLSYKHRAALTLLEYGLLNQVGFCVITGEPGAGKTTILRALLERVPDNVTVGLITNTHQSFGGLLDWILSAFNLHRPNLTHVEMHQLFMDYLIEEYANNRTVLLIIDEAQNMKPETLEELRMLSNVNSDKDQLMQVMLAGQPALKDTLRKPELMQFAQRIAVDYHLESLGVKETCGYIQHRLITAGAERDIFTPAACHRIHSYSGGSPRLINLLCETVLIYGFADQLEMIDVDLVDEMVLERMKNSLVPLVNRDAAEKDNKQAYKQLEQDFPWIKSNTAVPDLISEATTPVAEKKPVINEPAKQASAIVEQPVAIESAAIEPAAIEPAAKKVAAEDKSSYVNRGRGKPIGSENKTKVTGAQSVQIVPEKIQDDHLAASATTKVEAGANKKLVKYGLFTILIVLVFIAVILLLSGKISYREAMNWLSDKGAGINGTPEIQKLREQEAARVIILQVEAEALKKQRDAAIAKVEEEKRAKQQIEKLAAEKAALTVKTAENKRKLEEKQRLMEVEKRERIAKQREARSRAEADRLKREAAELAKEKRLMTARVEEKVRIKQQQEAGRLAAERLEIQRQQQLLQEQEAKFRAEQLAAARVKEQDESKLLECRGPAARYKASCRD